MADVIPDELKRAVEHQLVCKAWLVGSVPVHETHDGQTVWDDVVHVFALDYNGDIDRAYGWTYERPDGQRRFFVVEHAGPVTSPRDAVRAAIVAEHGGRR